MALDRFVKVTPWLLALCALPSPSSAQEAVDPRAERIDAILAHCHEHGMFNGVLLVREEGRAVYEGAFGVKAPDDPAPLDVDTCFLLGSVSKQFTATAVMLLEQDGLLAYDDELVDLLPELAPFAEGVTVHHLLTHSSGVPDHINELHAERPGMTNADVVAVLREHGRLNFPPGTRASYSNGGYVLLAEIVEAVSGEPLAGFLQERVFEPLAMESTFVRTESTPLEACAVGFDLVGTRQESEWLTTGPGGVFSTADDLARWDDALAGGSLLTPATLERAFTPNRLADGTETSFGYGWQVVRMGPTTRVFHMGASAGYRAYLHRDLEAGRTIAVLSNCRHGISGDAMRAIDSVVRGGPMPPLPRVEGAPYLGFLIRTRGIEAALERFDELREAGGEAFDLGEDQVNVLGYDCLRVGEVDLALALFRKNAEVHPDSSNAHDSLGEALAASGDREQAIASYERSLELDSGNASARERLEELRGSR